MAAKEVGTGGAEQGWRRRRADARQGGRRGYVPPVSAKLLSVFLKIAIVCCWASHDIQGAFQLKRFEYAYQGGKRHLHRRFPVTPWPIREQTRASNLYKRRLWRAALKFVQEVSAFWQWAGRQRRRKSSAFPSSILWNFSYPAFWENLKKKMDKPIADKCLAFFTFCPARILRWNFFHLVSEFIREVLFVCEIFHMNYVQNFTDF